MLSTTFKNRSGIAIGNCVDIIYVPSNNIWSLDYDQNVFKREFIPKKTFCNTYESSIQFIYSFKLPSGTSNGSSPIVEQSIDITRTYKNVSVRYL